MSYDILSHIADEMKIFLEWFVQHMTSMSKHVASLAHILFHSMFVYADNIKAVFVLQILGNYYDYKGWF
jgi:hypothetical protein